MLFVCVEFHVYESINPNYLEVEGFRNTAIPKLQNEMRIDQVISHILLIERNSIERRMAKEKEKNNFKSWNASL